MTRTAFKLIRLGGLIAPAAEGFMTYGGEEGIKHFVYRYTGYSMWDGSWRPERLLQGFGAYLGACLATYGIPKVINIIRRL